VFHENLKSWLWMCLSSKLEQRQPLWVPVGIGCLEQKPPSSFWSTLSGIQVVNQKDDGGQAVVIFWPCPNHGVRSL
jgi:hypothetical protein